MSEDKKTDTVSQNLDDLALIGKVEDTVEPIKGYKIKIQTLDSEENGRALMRTAITEDALVKFDILKRATLMIAIEKINDKKLTEKEKETFLNKLQPAVIDVIYDEYSKLLAKQRQILEDLKKN